MLIALVAPCICIEARRGTVPEHVCHVVQTVACVEIELHQMAFERVAWCERIA